MKITRQLMLAAALVLGTATVASAQYPWQEPIGRTKRCVCGGQVEVDNRIYKAGGSLSPLWEYNSPPGEFPAWSRVRIAAFNNTQVVEQYGTLTWSVDQSRILQSTITAVSDAPFPARANFAFHAIVKTESGLTLRTMDQTPLIFDGLIQTWPKRDEPFNQVGDLWLERADRPGEPLIRVSRISVRVSDQ